MPPPTKVVKALQFVVPTNRLLKKRSTRKECTMNAIRFTTIALLVAASTTSTAMADGLTGPLSRAQVRAELANARANGTMPVEVERQQRQYDPSRSGLTREAVIAELNRARASGNMPIEVERQQRQYDPSDSSLTREAVIAELYQARANGTMPVSEESRASAYEPPAVSGRLDNNARLADRSLGLSRGEKNRF